MNPGVPSFPVWPGRRQAERFRPIRASAKNAAKFVPCDRDKANRLGPNSDRLSLFRCDGKGDFLQVNAISDRLLGAGSFPGRSIPHASPDGEKRRILNWQAGGVCDSHLGFVLRRTKLQQFCTFSSPFHCYLRKIYVKLNPRLPQGSGLPPAGSRGSTC